MPLVMILTLSLPVVYFLSFQPAPAVLITFTKEKTELLLLFKMVLYLHSLFTYLNVGKLHLKNPNI